MTHEERTRIARLGGVARGLQQQHACIRRHIATQEFTQRTASAVAEAVAEAIKTDRLARHKVDPFEVRLRTLWREARAFSAHSKRWDAVRRHLGAALYLSLTAHPRPSK